MEGSPHYLSPFGQEKLNMHSYFQKHMRNQTLVMERTAMGRQAVMSIMTNELTRRLQVLDERLDKNEVIEVIDKYVQQLKNSGFNWKQTRDIVVSSIKGHVRKEKLRRNKNRPRYRTGKQSLEARVSKKLNEKYNWFRKDIENIEDEADEKTEDEKATKISDKKRWHHYEKKKERIVALEKEIMPTSPAKAVLFVQYTENSGLAGQIRELVNSLKPWTGIGLKIVERAGDKLDILHKSNPWSDEDCERNSCPTCRTSCESDEYP